MAIWPDLKSSKIDCKSKKINLNEIEGVKGKKRERKERKKRKKKNPQKKK